MRIVLDAMGSDQHPEPEIEAAVQAASSLEVEIVLAGPRDLLQMKMEAAGGAGLPVEIVHAPDNIEMTDDPVESARRNDQTSMAVGMNMLKEGAADAFVTAGNTGAAMANALFRLGRLRGVKRPALTAVFPVRNGQAVVLDIGANTECKPIHLLQFAGMGSVYAHRVLEINRPRVGLLSIGEEAGKGNQLVKESYPLLRRSNLNFLGNVESKEVFGGEVDVLVTDGFTGNIVLKTSEAVARLIVDLLRQELTAGTRVKLGALLARPAFEQIRRLLDPAEVGAAPLLGVDGLVFIGHGRSDARALINAIRIAQQAAQAGLLDSVRTAIAEQLEQINT